MKASEENYVDLMKRGDERGLQYFIEHHGWIVKSIICKRMANFENEWADCMNDVFLAIWDNVGKYDSSWAAFTTWAAAVTRYRILHYMRKLNNAAWEEDVEVVQLVGEMDVRTELYFEEEEKEFRSLLSDLSEQDQEIFVKLFWDELNHDEISEDLKIPKPVLYNRISRGKKKLRNSIGRERRCDI